MTVSCKLIRKGEKHLDDEAISIDTIREFFIGITRKISIDKINEEIAFKTNTQDDQIEIIEKFRLIISGNNITNVIYTTQTNLDGDIAVESILRTHIANILYSLLMLETGYVNGLIENE